MRFNRAIEEIGERLDKIDKKFDKVDRRLDSLEDKVGLDDRQLFAIKIRFNDIYALYLWGGGDVIPETLTKLADYDPLIKKQMDKFKITWTRGTQEYGKEISGIVCGRFFDGLKYGEVYDTHKLGADTHFGDGRYNLYGAMFELMEARKRGEARGRLHN